MSTRTKIIATVLSLTLLAVMVPTGVAQAALTESQIQSILSLLTSFGADATTVANVEASLRGTTPTTPTTPTTITGIPAGFTFTKTLKIGDVDQDVVYLKIVLVAEGCVSGLSNTTYFGSQTKAGVQCFQKKYGTGSLGTTGPNTRAKLNEILTGGVVTPPVTPPSGSGLSVGLAVDTPASANVADNANSIFTKFTLTAGSAGDVTITKLYVTRSGISANSDVENIKIIDENGVYQGSVGSLNTDNRAMITFTQGLKISAGTTKPFFIRAGILNNASSGRTVVLGINAADDIISNASAVSGAFPIKGNTMTIVDSPLGTATVSEDTTVDSKPNVGDTDVQLNAFSVAAGSTENLTIESITMVKSGTVSNSYISNLELYDVTGNKTLSTVASLTAEGKATWTNLNLLVPKGNTQKFKIMCDIVDGPGQTIDADIVDGSDVLITVKGNTYGFYITPTASGSWNGLGTTQNINSGALTVSKSASTPATGKVSAGDNQTIAVFDFYARGEQVKISSLKVSFDLGTMTETEVTNIKVYDENGGIVAGPGDLGTTDYAPNTTTYEGYVTFADVFIVPTGIHKYTVKAKLANTVSTSDTIKAAIADADSDITAKGMTSNSSITASPSASEVNGNTLTVAAGALVLRTLDYPVARNVAKGTQDLMWATVSLDATDSGEDVIVSSISVLDTTAGSGPGQADYIDNMELWGDLTSANYTSATRNDAYETLLVSTPSNPSGNTAGDDVTTAFSLSKTVTVTKGTFVKVALIADLNTSETTDATHLFTFSTATVTGYSTSRTITATTSGDGETMTVKASGTLTVSRDSSSPVANLMLANETASLAVFRLAADTVEDLDLDEMTVSVSGGNYMDTIYLYKSDGTTLIGSAAGTEQVTFVISDGTVTIPANSYTKVVVKAKANSVASLKAASADGTTVNARLVSSTVKPSITANVKVTGKDSGTQTSHTTAYEGYNMTLYRTRPYFSLADESPSGPNFVPSTSTLVAVFDVKAGAEDVTFDKATNANTITMAVSIQQTDTPIQGYPYGTFTLIDSDSYTLDTATMAATASGTITFNFYDPEGTDNDLTVSANMTKRLYVYADTTNNASATTNNTGLSIEDPGDSILVYLDDGTSTNVSWGIDGSGSYDHADIIFRGDIRAKALSVPAT